MARFRCISGVAFFSASVLMATNVSHALTAREVMQEMPEQKRFSYLSGIVDTLSYQSLLDGNRQRAECIVNAFYKDKDGLGRIINMLYAYPDKGPVAILLVALKKECAS